MELIYYRKLRNNEANIHYLSSLYCSNYLPPLFKFLFLCVISIGLEEAELLFEIYSNRVLSSLALIHQNYETNIDVIKACQPILEKQPR